MDLAAWAKPASPGRNCRMNWCVSLLALVPFQALLSFFFHVCGGWEVVLPPSHIHPCPEVPPFPSSPYMRQRKGRGLGGQGSPSVLRLHRVFRLNQENFLLPKNRKRKKNKPAQRPPFLPAPRTVATGSGGLPGGWEPSGLDTQARVVEAGGALPPPGPLSPPQPPPSAPPEVAFP